MTLDSIGGQIIAVMIEDEQQRKIMQRRETLIVVAKFTLVVLAIVVLSVLIYKSDLLRIFLSKRRSSTFFHSLGNWSPLGFILLQAVQVVVAPIPGDVTGLIGGYLYGPWLGLLYSTVGLTIGSWLAFALAHWGGKPFVRRFVPERSLKRFNFLLTNKGSFIVFLLFLLPGFPKDYLCFILGLGAISTSRFIVISSVGRLLGTVLLTLGGSYLRVREYFKFSIVCGIALIFILLIVVYRDKIENLFRRWQRNTKEDLKN